MLKLLKRLFCRHQYELNRWHVCHGPNGNDPSMIEEEAICVKCGKLRYRDWPIKFIGAYAEVCDEYERRIK